jgi:hypothetical protein
MKIFFCASTNYQIGLLPTYKEITTCVINRGDDLLNSWVVDQLHGLKPHKSSKEVLLMQNKLIQDADAVIIESSTPSFGVGYLLAQALQLHKPILCLFPNDGDEKLLSDGIKGNTSSLIDLKLYANDITKIINSYLDGLDLNSLIKFNFVANKQVIEFLKKGSQNESKSMSEYLRDLIENDHIRNKDKQ